MRPAKLAALHRALYDGRATADEVFHALARQVKTVDVADLLGSHGREGEWGTEGPADSVVVDAIRRIVEKWPPPETPITGRSLTDVLKQERVQPSVDPAVLAVTRRALLAASVADRHTRRRSSGLVPALVPLPDPRDRRAGVSRAAGVTPLLYASTLVDRRSREASATHVYLDVSGSVEPWLDDLYGALSALRGHIAPLVHLFSTRIASVPVAALRDGVRRTTGGTSADCVFAHALGRPVRKVLLITDGYVGAPPARLQQAVRERLDVRVLLTPGGFRRDLTAVASRFDELPGKRLRLTSRHATQAGPRHPDTRHAGTKERTR